MMLFDIITIFPEMIHGVIQKSIVRRAQDKGLVSIRVRNLRDFSEDKHHKVDDVPFGGGPGMVLKAGPLHRAVKAITQENSTARRIYLTPDGKIFNQEMARDLARESHLVLVCGHYEGIDQRVRDTLIDDEISIGDYVLTGGELPALVLLDAVVRLIPGALGSEESLEIESFSDHMLDYPQYTRPRVFEGMEVPQILLSGHHEEIRKWRRRQSLLHTLRRRPDLFRQIALTAEDKDLLRDS
ncbi:MAG: tRNA (guanosine(37)-N1)-methyltransferase TrmD [bacterium]